MDEIFKPIFINGDITKYMISSFGRCLNTKTNKFIKPHINKYINRALDQNTDAVYYEYFLYHNKKYHYLLAHRLVAIAFIPIPKKYTEISLTYEDLDVDHINNIRYDNTVENLQWLTKTENYEKMLNNGNKRYANGELHGNAVLTNNQIFKVYDLLVENELTQKEISFLTNVPYKTVNKIYKKKAFLSLTIQYDFSNYNCFDRNIIDDEKIILALKLLSSGKYSIKQCSKKSGINYNTLKSIVQGKKQEYNLKINSI